MWPQAKECRVLSAALAAGRGQKGPSPKDFVGGSGPDNTLVLATGLQNCEETHFSSLSCTDYGNFLQQHLLQYYTIEASNCGVGEDSWESLGQQGDQAGQS